MIWPTPPPPQATLCHQSITTIQPSPYHQIQAKPPSPTIIHPKPIPPAYPDRSNPAMETRHKPNKRRKILTYPSPHLGRRDSRGAQDQTRGPGVLDSRRDTGWRSVKGELK